VEVLPWAGGIAELLEALVHCKPGMICNFTSPKQWPENVELLRLDFFGSGQLCGLLLCKTLALPFLMHCIACLARRLRHFGLSHECSGTFSSRGPLSQAPDHDKSSFG
jgi:hypothetical protein